MVTQLQAVIWESARKAGVDGIVLEATAHPYTCRCEKCRMWWKVMGPEEDGSYGPFTREEIERNDD